MDNNTSGNNRAKRATDALKNGADAAKGILGSSLKLVAARGAVDLTEAGLRMALSRLGVPDHLLENEIARGTFRVFFPLMLFQGGVALRDPLNEKLGEGKAEKLCDIAETMQRAVLLEGGINIINGAKSLVGMLFNRELADVVVGFADKMDALEAEERALEMNLSADGRVAEYVPKA